MDKLNKLVGPPGQVIVLKGTNQTVCDGSVIVPMSFGIRNEGRLRLETDRT